MQRLPPKGRKVSCPNRREALERILTLGMFGAAAGTAAYIKRDELANLLPRPRYKEWEPWVMLVRNNDPERTSREQAIVLASTDINLWCEENGYGYNNVAISDDLSAKRNQIGRMQEFAAEKPGPYMIAVNKDGYLFEIPVPSDKSEAIKLLNEVNNV